MLVYFQYPDHQYKQKVAHTEICQDHSHLHILSILLQNFTGNQAALLL